MGEFVTDLDYSYYSTGDSNNLPSPPPSKLHLPVPGRAFVSLPRRAQASAKIVPIVQPVPSFGFPISKAGPDASTQAPISSRRAAFRKTRSSTSRKFPNSVSRATRVGYPNRRLPARAAVAPPPETFASITATPGLDQYSFEELRAECYAIAVVATGAPPRPVPPADAPGLSTADASEGPPGKPKPVKIIPPMYLPFVSDGSRVELVLQATYEVCMSTDALSCDFTFEMPK
ncbi:hypothetical protein C8Q74DRAFT_934815 [Fomes fomentarius]|nr:hypothetical protein C8Q74DRAFT_934815 [Fomes fomentarius]